MLAAVNVSGMPRLPLELVAWLADELVVLQYRLGFVRGVVLTPIAVAGFEFRVRVPDDAADLLLLPLELLRQPLVVVQLPL